MNKSIFQLNHVDAWWANPPPLPAAISSLSKNPCLIAVVATNESDNVCPISERICSKMLVTFSRNIFWTPNKNQPRRHTPDAENCRWNHRQTYPQTTVNTTVIFYFNQIQLPVTWNPKTSHPNIWKNLQLTLPAGLRVHPNYQDSSDST